MTPRGILNVDKPEGITSFQVVARVRKLSAVKKVGHAGTLDPLATGVLLVCLSHATRVSEYLMELPKTYRGSVRLGVATDTFDATGATAFEGDAGAVDETKLKAALEVLERREEQTPPSYSAIKVRGTPAYRLARAGRPVSLRPRKANIERIDLLSFEPPLVELEIRCGKGTYIRTLADDLGRLLGCGAHLAALRRTAVGLFHVDDAFSINRLETAFKDESWQELLLPLDYGLGHFPAVYLEMEAEKDIRHGCALEMDSPPFQRLQDAQDGQRCRAYAEDGSFVGILRYDGESHRWKPQKVFISGHLLA
ncbi:MAG: tRNA pseudouridine(55) synthase TruB [Chloroflexi bacterium]|nr:tRNA pseudouridine(55) synthase TruB [Chloroflexota bacterium]